MFINIHDIIKLVIEMNALKNNVSYSVVKDYKIKRTDGFVYNIAKGYDSFGYMTNKLGVELRNLFEGGYSVGIHRTGYTNVGIKYINDVFNNGLINNTGAMIGVNKNDEVYIDDTVTLFDNFLVMYGQIKAAYKYKDSNGVIIVRIPSAYVGKKDGTAKPIYWEDSYGQVRLLPEYIYGYVPVNDGICGDIIKNPNYKDVHDYQNDGLIYDSSVEVSKVL